jgi:hypothetical protein
VDQPDERTFPCSDGSSQSAWRLFLNDVLAKMKEFGALLWVLYPFFHLNKTELPKV